MMNETIVAGFIGQSNVIPPTLTSTDLKNVQSPQKEEKTDKQQKEKTKETSERSENINIQREEKTEERTNQV